MKAHLTKRYIENIQPDKTRTTITDTKTRGLTLLVEPSGVKTFYLIRKFQGKPERNNLGRFPETTLLMAKTKATKLHAIYDDGISPFQEQKRALSAETVDAFFEIYYRDHCQIKNRRPEKAKAEYVRYISPAFGDMRLADVKRVDIRRLMDRIANVDGHPRTANIVHTITRAMFNKAIAWEYLDARNPADHIERYPEKVRKRVLSLEELPRFHEALKLEESDTNRDAILMLMYTGARKMNVLSMHWSDVDLERAIWLIPETKNGESHPVSLTSEALSILKRRCKSRGSVYVFPGKGRLGHLENIKKAWERLLNRAGIDDLWVHDLRRTVGSFMANLGASQSQIQMQLGHKDPQSTKPYVHMHVDYVRDKIGEVTALISNEKRKNG